MTARAAPAPNDLLVALPRLRRYARVLMGEVREADGLLTDTLERAREESPQQASHAAPRTRLFALMHERYLSQGATSRRKPASAVLGTGPATVPAPAPPSSLLMHFGRLPVEEREVLLLVAVERMAYEEIGAVLAVPVATVISRLRRARALLRPADSSGLGRDPQIGD